MFRKAITSILARSTVLAILAISALAQAQSSWGQQRGLTNPGFEEPRVKDASFALVETTPGWKTTDTHFEIWSSGFLGVPSHEGTQFAELNAYIHGTLYQDSTGIQRGSVLEFTFAHRGRSGADTMKLTITDLGADNSLGGGDDTVLFAKEYTTGKDAWAVYNSTNEQQIEALGNTVRFAYGAISTATGELGEGNLLDAADFGVGVVSEAPTSPSIATRTINLINASFEEPRVEEGSFALVTATPGWKTTDTVFEIWSTGFEGFEAHDGTQFAELNAKLDGTLYQDLADIGRGALLDFSFAHRGRNGDDTMKLTITDLGSDNSLGGGDDTVLFTKEYTTRKEAWAVYDSTNEQKINALGNTVRFAYTAIYGTGGKGPDKTEGNFLDSVNFGVGVIRAEHQPTGLMRLQTFGINSEDSESHYLGIRDGRVGIPDETNPSSGSIPVLAVEATGIGTTLHVFNSGGQYLTARGKEIVLCDVPESGSFWRIRDPLKQDLQVSDGWFSLESASDPGRYLRHYVLLAFADKVQDLNSSEAEHFLADASWRFVKAKVFDYSMEVISGNGQSYGGGGMPKAMVLRIKDSSGQYLTDLEGAGLTIDVSANKPGEYDLPFNNVSVEENDKTLFKGYYYVPDNGGEAPYKLQITVQLKKAGEVVGECLFEQNIK